MRNRNKDREQFEPQINNWNAEFNKLERKNKKGGSGPKSDYRIVMAALRQPRNKSKQA